MNKDEQLLAEAYLKIIESETKCMHAKEGCECDSCDDCKSNQKVEEAKDAKPDYLDVDDDGDTDEPMKKALKDKEEVEESMPEVTMDNYDSPEMTQKALDAMENLRTKDPAMFEKFLARLLQIANHPAQPNQHNQQELNNPVSY
jgi:hypothetical protein